MIIEIDGARWLYPISDCSLGTDAPLPLVQLVLTNVELILIGVPDAVGIRVHSWLVALAPLPQVVLSVPPPRVESLRTLPGNFARGSTDRVIRI